MGESNNVQAQDIFQEYISKTFKCLDELVGNQSKE